MGDENSNRNLINSQRAVNFVMPCRNPRAVTTVLKHPITTHFDANAQRVLPPAQASSTCSNICRICFSGEEVNKLFKFCHCSGTIEFCHHDCLARWIQQSNINVCELCGYPYQLERRPMRICNWQCPPFQPTEHFFLIIYFVAWLTLAGSITWLCFVIFGDESMYRDSELAPLIYGLYGLIAIASLGIIIFESIFILRPFLRNIFRYNHVTQILPYDPTRSRARLNDFPVVNFPYDSVALQLPIRSELQYHLGNPYQMLHVYWPQIFPQLSLTQSEIQAATGHQERSDQRNVSNEDVVHLHSSNSEENQRVDTASEDLSSARTVPIVGYDRGIISSPYSETRSFLTSNDTSNYSLQSEESSWEIWFKDSNRNKHEKITENQSGENSNSEFRASVSSNNKMLVPNEPLAISNHQLNQNTVMNEINKETVLISECVNSNHATEAS